MSTPSQRDCGKEWFWRRMVQQWRRSGLSVRAVCAAHNLTEPSFYSWRRTLAQRDPQGHGQPGSKGSERKVRPPLFVPVQVSAIASAPLEVVLERGRIVRVPAGFDATTLRQLLAVLAEAPPC
jgi:transposase-like protein